MPRRLLVFLLSALALLLVAAPAGLAAATPQASPIASTADDPPSDDGDCSDDPDVALPACDDGWEDDAELCDADLSEDVLRASAAQQDEEWGDEEAGADEEAWPDEETWPDDDCTAVVAPTISRLAVAVSGRGARSRVRVAFSLDLPGEIELTLARVERGLTRGGRCAAAPARSRKQAKKAKRPGKRGKPCSRTVALRGAVVVDGDEGANATELRRRWSGRALAAGSYKLTATPLDDGGASVSAGFALAGRAGGR